METVSLVDIHYALLGGFLDIYGLASPWLHFTNFAFSAGSAAIDVPNDVVSLMSDL